MSLGVLPDVTRWKGLKSIGMIESERTIDGKMSIGRRHYICSLTEVGRFAHAVRKHQGVESLLHWVLYLERAIRVFVRAMCLKISALCVS
jgi:predicted transposase YbfD/YdcC